MLLILSICIILHFRFVTPDACCMDMSLRRILWYIFLVGIVPWASVQVVNFVTRHGYNTRGGYSIVIQDTRSETSDMTSGLRNSDDTNQETIGDMPEPKSPVTPSLDTNKKEDPSAALVAEAKSEETARHETVKYETEQETLPPTLHPLVAKPPETKLQDTKKPDKVQNNTKIHSILIYNSPHWINMTTIVRHLNRCNSSNCFATRQKGNLSDHSAVLFFMTSDSPLPKKPPFSQTLDQVWIFGWHEAPERHHYFDTNYMNIYWKDRMNWTMSYTHDADINMYYGVINKLPYTPPVRNYSAIFHMKTEMATWAVSNCDAPSKRSDYVQLLQRYGVNIDIFGECSGKHINKDVLLKKVNMTYKFYLAFENSLCKDYITEKFFQYFKYDVVLVVRGGGNYSRLLPDDAYINTANFNNVKDLANYLKDVGSSEEKYTKYLQNKDKYQSGYMKPGVFCQICQKLNNLKYYRRTYPNLLNDIHDGTCYEPNDIK